MKTIIAAVDLTDTSLPVIKATGELARQIGSSVTLLHVVRPVILLSEISDYVEEARVTAERTAEKVLKEYKFLLEAKGISTTISLCTGDPATELLAVSRAIEPLYIVIGSHGRNALYKLLIGSTAEAVLSHADCPVLVVRSSGATAHSPSTLHHQESAHA